MNWYKEHKMVEAFYRLVTEGNYRFAMSPSVEYKKIDLKRWGKLHAMLSKIVGLTTSDPDFLDKFMELSDVFRELTDRLGRLPKKEEFVNAWRSWELYKGMRHPERIKEEYAYPMGGSTKIPQPNQDFSVNALV